MINYSNLTYLVLTLIYASYFIQINSHKCISSCLSFIYTFSCILLKYIWHTVFSPGSVELRDKIK